MDACICLSALTHLPARVHLLIIGDGPERPHLEQYAATLGVAARVHWLGAVSDADKYRYYCCCDVFVLASEHEGFGIVLQEAMHAGLPIVTTFDGGQQDVITPDRNALVVPVGDSAAIARAVMRLHDNTALRRAIGSVNQSDICRQYASAVANEYVSYYQDLLQRRRA